ncbi:MAG TPA: hypothetical protein VGE43_05045 [Acidimicrobiales bacterium]
MRTKTKILTTVAAGTLALGAFAAGAGADDGDTRQARNEMHAQMGGAMGAGMMSGDSWESMQAMHEAIDPAVMQQMHDEMVEQLPPELRADAEAMHDQMFPAMTGADGVDHASHHPTGS